MGKIILIKDKIDISKMSLEIAYDEGFIKLDKKQFPETVKILSTKNLSENDSDNLDGQLINVRSVPTRIRGGNAILSELIVSKTENEIICKELNVEKLPVLFRPIDRMMIMIVSEK